MSAQRRPAPRLPLPVTIAIGAALYSAIAQLSLIYATAPGRVSAIWPLAGISLVVLVRRRDLWPAVLIGDFATALMIGLPPVGAAGVALAATAEALAGRAILCRATGGEPSSDRLSDVAALIGVAAVAPGIGGLLAALGLLAGGAIRPDEIGQAWVTWWVGDLIGVLLVPPLLMRCDRYFRSVISPARVVEAALFYLALAVVSLVLFRGNLDYSYMVAPLLIWATLRVGPRGTAIATLLFASIAVRGTSQGLGPFAQVTLGASLIYLQTFVGVMALGSLVLGAAIAERRQTERALRLAADVGALLGQWREESTPQALAERLAASHADVCALIVPQPGGPPRLHVAGPAGLREAAAAHGAGGPLPPALVAVGRAEDGARLQIDGPAGRIFDAVGASAAVVAPLRLRGHAAGALALYRLRAGQSYRREDLALVEDLARRIAQAIERARLEAHMVQAQKLESIGLLAGGVAHDFNNLIAVILAAAQLLRAEQAPAPAEDLDAIIDAGQRAQLLTQRLLAFARRQPLTPRVVDVDELVAGVLPLVRRVIRPGVQFSYAADGALGAVRIDVAQFEQVLMNLVINAQEAMPAGGELTLAASVVPPDAEPDAEPDGPACDYVCLALTDTGVGMSDEVRARAFEPFFTTKGERNSSGLGLASSYGIVHQSGGRMTVESAPGAGSTFRVYLPRVAPGGGSQAE